MSNEVPGDAGYHPEVFAKNQVIRNRTDAERIADLEQKVKELKKVVNILRVKVGGLR